MTALEDKVYIGDNQGNVIIIDATTHKLVKQFDGLFEGSSVSVMKTYDRSILMGYLIYSIPWHYLFSKF